MKIGLIGAGRMGFTLGRHLSDFAKSHAEMLCVEGFYSRNPESAREAARFTGRNTMKTWRHWFRRVILYF